MTRIALGVEYDGSNYQGFQKQFEVNSIQQCLEEAVGRIANHKVDIFCAGRTDAGVNATQQVIHFDYLGDKPRDVSSWMRTPVFPHLSVPTAISYLIPTAVRLF